MKRTKLEVCVDSVESALAASRGGADRLELCGCLPMGGTTPELSLYRAVRHCTDLPVRVLIRPRAGDFCYSVYEFGIMCDAVALFREEGADAVVTGCLTPEGDVDLERMKRLREAAGTMDMTFHRAFDMVKDAGQALRDIVSLGGISTILTSGQAPDVEKGIGNLKAIIAGADGRLDIMPGGGVNSGNLEHLEEELHAPVYHMSGKMAVSSRMIYRNPAVSMGEDSSSEYRIWRTDEEEVRKARAILG